MLLIGESKHRTMDITLPNHSGLFNKLANMLAAITLSKSGTVCVHVFLENKKNPDLTLT